MGMMVFLLIRVKRLVESSMVRVGGVLFLKVVSVLMMFFW